MMRLISRSGVISGSISVQQHRLIRVLHRTAYCDVPVWSCVNASLSADFGAISYWIHPVIHRNVSLLSSPVSSSSVNPRVICLEILGNHSDLPRMRGKFHSWSFVTYALYFSITPGLLGMLAFVTTVLWASASWVYGDHRIAALVPCFRYCRDTAASVSSSLNPSSLPAPARDLRL